MTVPSGAVVGGAQDEVGDQRGPARLVAGADAPAGVTVEVLVEGQQVVPVPVGLEEAGVAEDRAAAVLVVEEDRNQTAGEVVGQDGQGDLASRAGGVLDEDVVAEEPGVGVQRLDERALCGAAVVAITWFRYLRSTGRAASAFVSNELGFKVHFVGGFRTARAWRSAIDRERRWHEGGRRPEVRCRSADGRSPLGTDYPICAHSADGLASRRKSAERRVRARFSTDTFA